MRLISSIIIAAILFAAPANSRARRHTTTSHRLKAVTTPADSAAHKPRESIVTAPDTSAITIAGYDKPVDSRIETFFIVNRSSHHLKGITVTLTYFDTSGRQLHQATHNVDCDIPPGHTRQATVPSWDRQQSFYYTGSRTPRRRSTPFTVTCRITSATITDALQP